MTQAPCQAVPTLRSAQRTLPFCPRPPSASGAADPSGSAGTRAGPGAGLLGAALWRLLWAGEHMARGKATLDKGNSHGGCPASTLSGFGAAQLRWKDKNRDP